MMFTRDGIIELHTVMHERMDLLLRHVATVPDAVSRIFGERKISSSMVTKPGFR